MLRLTTAWHGCRYGFYKSASELDRLFDLLRKVLTWLTPLRTAEVVRPHTAVPAALARTSVEAAMRFAFVHASRLPESADAHISTLILAHRVWYRSAEHSADVSMEDNVKIGSVVARAGSRDLETVGAGLPRANVRSEASTAYIRRDQVPTLSPQPSTPVHALPAAHPHTQAHTVDREVPASIPSHSLAYLHSSATQAATQGLHQGDLHNVSMGRRCCSKSQTKLSRSSVQVAAACG